MPAPKGHPPYHDGLGGRPKLYTLEFIDNEAEELIKWIEDKNNKSIFLNEFALKRKFSRQRLVEFAKKSEKFMDAYDLAKNWQEIKILTGGLTKKYEPNFCKYIMPRVCGEEWKEQKNLNITTNGPVAEWIVEAEGKSADLINE